MRIWAMYRSRTVLFSMAILVLFSLIAMGLLEGFGYANVKGMFISKGGKAFIAQYEKLTNYSDFGTCAGSACLWSWSSIASLRVCVLVSLFHSRYENEQL